MATRTGGRVAQVDVAWCLERRAETPAWSFRRLAEHHDPPMSPAAIHKALKGIDPAPPVEETRLLPWELGADIANEYPAPTLRALVRRDVLGLAIRPEEERSVNRYLRNLREMFGDRAVVAYDHDRKGFVCRPRRPGERPKAGVLAYRP